MMIKMLHLEVDAKNYQIYRTGPSSLINANPNPCEAPVIIVHILTIPILDHETLGTR
jgi:hypothetical protein